MSRRNNRKNPHKTPPSQRNGNGPEHTSTFTEPPPPFVDDCSRIWIGGEPNTPPPTADGDEAPEAGRGSRFNSLQEGLRSRLLFPDRMKQAIDARTVEFAGVQKPRNPLESFLVGQMARGSVQSEFAGDQLILNRSLAVERVDIRWADDHRERAAQLGNQLSTAPCRIAGALGRSKYGALYLIDKLTSLRESIESNSGVSPEQREYLFDILGVDPILRYGSQRVPAGNNGPALAAVVDKELARLRTKVEQCLTPQDENEQNAARYGIVRIYDKETRNLRGDQSRADRRFKWAWQALGQLRAGVDPASIIDPETKRPIRPEAQAAPAAEEATPEAPTPTSPPPSESSDSSAPRTARIPEGCPEDMKEMFLLLGEAFFRTSGSADKETLRSDGPSKEPGPPLA